jgi:hypothetical protein
MMVALFIVIAAIGADLVGWIRIDWTLARAGAAFVAVIALAGAGKAFGLARAHRGLRAKVDRLAGALRQRGAAAGTAAPDPA